MSKKNRRERKKRHSQRKRAVAAATPEKLTEKGDFRGAAALLEAQLQSNPSDELRRKLAYCYMETSNYAQTASTLLELGEKSPNDLGLTGWCFIQLEDWDKAIDQLSKGLEIEETAEDLYWLAIAQAKGQMDRYELEEETKTSIMKLLEAAIKFPKCRLGAFFWLEHLQVGPDALEKRVAILREAIKLHPGSLDAATRLAELLISPRLEKPEEALKVISTFLEGESPPTIALWYAFSASKRLGDLKQALRYLEAIRLEPERKEIDLALVKGNTLVSLGQLDKAVNHYDEVIGKGDLEQRILGLFGRAWVAVEAEDAKLAVLEAQRAADLWFGAIVEDDSFSLYMSYIVIGGEGFDYWESNASVRAVCQSLLHKDEFKQGLNKGLQGLLYYLAYKEQVANRDDEESERMLSKAYEILDHPRISEDLSYHYLEPGKISRGVHHHLNYCLWKHATRDPSKPFPSYLAELDFLDWDDKHRVGAGDYTPVHQTALTHLEGCGKDEIRDVIVPFYSSFWRRVLFEAKMFQEVVQVTNSLLEHAPDSESILFDHAYGLNEIGKPAEAETTYKRLIELEPRNANAMHNLSILLEEKDRLEEA